LLRVLQVKQCEAKINKNLQCYLTKRKYHTERHQEYTKRTPRDPPKLHFISQNRVQNCTKITWEKWERVREGGEKFWYNGVVKTSYQNEEKELLLKEGKRRDPS
jgi:hypothetical protein